LFIPLNGFFCLGDYTSSAIEQKIDSHLRLPHVIPTLVEFDSLKFSGVQSSKERSGIVAA